MTAVPAEKTEVPTIRVAVPVSDCTDVANAERFVEQHGNDLIYVKEIGRHHWAENHYAKDTIGEWERRGKKTARTIYNEISRCEREAERKKLADHARRSENAKALRDMLTVAESDEAIRRRPEELDADQWLFNCKNVTINLRDGKAKEHRRGDLITKVAPIIYEESADCVLFKNFLHRIFAGDEDLIRYIQQLAGMFLTGDVSEHILPIFWGEGCNGKSLLVDTLIAMMGDYACQAPPYLLTARGHDEHPCEIADLCGKRLVVSSETEEGRRLRIEFVKQLTGDHFLKGRFQRRDYFQFGRTHKTVLVTNNVPTIREGKQAIWRRIRLVPFAVVIPPQEQDKNLFHKFKDEWPGILNWAIGGCLDWQQSGFLEPEAVIQATSEYREDENALGQFIEDVCDLGNPEASTSRTEAWQAYVQWGKANGERYPLSRKGFIQRIRELAGVADSFVTRQGKRTRGLRGLAIDESAIAEHMQR